MLVTNREVGDGPFFISQLGFDVETRIKFLLLGRVPFSLGRSLDACPGVAVGASLAGHGWPSRWVNPAWKLWLGFIPAASQWWRHLHCWCMSRRGKCGKCSHGVKMGMGTGSSRCAAGKPTFTAAVSTVHKDINHQLLGISRLYSFIRI